MDCFLDGVVAAGPDASAEIVRAWENENYEQTWCSSSLIDAMNVEVEDEVSSDSLHRRRCDSHWCWYYLCTDDWPNAWRESKEGFHWKLNEDRWITASFSLDRGQLLVDTCEYHSGKLPSSTVDNGVTVWCCRLIYAGGQVNRGLTDPTIWSCKVKRTMVLRRWVSLAVDDQDTRGFARISCEDEICVLDTNNIDNRGQWSESRWRRSARR